MSSMSESDACTDLWVAAIMYYLIDSSYGILGRQVYGSKDAAESALHDLFGNRAQLKRLCSPIGVDADCVGDWMIDRLEDTLQNGKTYKIPNTCKW